MANSLIVGGLKVGMKVAVSTPADHKPDEKVLEFAKGYGDMFELTENIMDAACKADVVFTDVWASMGMEKEAEERKKVFAGYQVNSELLSVCAKDVMVQHCLPAHRGEEISEEVFEAHADEIFDEAENRLHAQKAIMVKLMEDK